MNIAVTGAAGRLGTFVCRALLEAGHTTKATDLRLNRESGVRIEVANLLDRVSCYRLVEGADVLVHLGNHPHIYGRPLAQTYAENCAMNANIFQAALESGVKKWIFSSSIQAMRGTHMISENRPSVLAYLPADGNAPANPSNSYGLSKAAAEEMMRYYATVEGCTCVAIRYPMLLNLEEKPFEKRVVPQPYPYPDELFSYLDLRDAASLIPACVAAPLSGYHCYMPVAEQNLFRRPGRELIAEYFANVPLRKPIAEIDRLVDIGGITSETGWVPKYK
ncbi:MAG TPA: NAD(P)-dependent oxidoreductase [Tepidisphaeraceae bacterium]|jgi:nucleoside-diphosphate-sugar epimerase